MAERPFPTAKWFGNLGYCAICGKPATGVLRDTYNADLARACNKCGERVVRANMGNDAGGTTPRRMRGQP
jgi:DNA-directed RNA polymerase subunit RPC12/RpoP